MALQSSGSSADRIQSGSEGQRPSTVEAGQIRFNTTRTDFEVYDGSKWVMMRPPVDEPISDTNRTIGLSTAEGLEVSNGNLQAALGRGVYFDNSGKITTANTISPSNGDPAIFFNPKIVVDRRSDTISLVNGGQGPQTYTDLNGLDMVGTDATDPGSISPKIIEIPVPNECNRIVIETRSRYSSAPNPNIAYGTGTPGAAGTGRSEVTMGFMLVDPPDGAQVLSGNAAGRNQAVNSIGGSQVSINGSNGQGDSSYKTTYSQNRHDVISINALSNPGSRILKIKSVITQLTASSMVLEFQQPRFYIQPMFCSDPESIHYDFF